MVRVFDPTRSDPSLLLIRGVQDYFSRQTNSLSTPELKKAIDSFLSSSHYKPMFSAYDEANETFPEIILKSNCSYEHFFFQKNKHNFNHFKAVFEPESNKVYICSNFMRNLLEVKENLDRELVLAYDKTIRKSNFEKDDEMACSLIRSCRAQLSNYSWNEDLTREMTRLCARNLFKVFFRIFLFFLEISFFLFIYE